MGMMIRRNRGRRKAPVQPKKVEKKVEPVVEEAPTEEVVPPVETTSKLDFTADDIEKMNYLKLKSMAKKNGIEVEGRDVKDIRVDLIEKLGL
jgi:hypothetical protein